MESQQQTLKRSISLWQLVFYGLGTTIGGGIYALTGKVAGAAGMYAPLSFLISASLAVLTAFSFAEMATRYPYSAGEVHYVRAAFNRKSFSTLIGWLLIFTGIVSASALGNATAGFLYDMTGLPHVLLTVMIVLLLGAIAAWGITESVILVVGITLVEIGGLMLVVFSSGESLAQIGTRWPELIPPAAEIAVWGSIASGAFLAFYAFIGFEDMVNVAEEVKDVERSMPWAILICMAVTMVIYLLIIVTAILSVPPDVLAESNTPLGSILEHNGALVPPAVMGIISIFATVNGALVQVIMGARVLYGMAKGGNAPKFLGRVNGFTQTPLQATAAIVVLTLLFATLLKLAVLAKIASAIILVIFASVNAALLKLKLTEVPDESQKFRIPVWVPCAGTVACLALLAFEVSRYF